MDFARFIAPIPVDHFMAEHWGRLPLHIPAEGDAGETRRAMLSWKRLNQLFAVLPFWTEANVKVILDGQRVPAEHYMVDVDTAVSRVRRASPARMETFLAMGASLVAEGIEDIAPEIKAATAMLSETFASKSGANAYCSFRGMRAFKSHCDLHEVFSVHCEGEKVWRIYANRAADPIVTPEGEGAQALIDRVKGPVLMEVRMRPGDLLYIPRGFYHDALASDDASLHLTFATMPISGRIVLRVLEQIVIEDPAFRAYLPDARHGDGAPLREALAGLADKVAALMHTPRFASEIAARQCALADPPHALALPDRPALDFYVRTDRAAEIIRRDEGSFLALGDERVPLGELGDPTEWLLTLPAFSLQQLFAHYPWRSRDELEQLVGQLRDKGVIAPYRPSLR